MCNELIPQQNGRDWSEKQINIVLKFLLTDFKNNLILVIKWWSYKHQIPESEYEDILQEYFVLRPVGGTVKHPSYFHAFLYHYKYETNTFFGFLNHSLRQHCGHWLREWLPKNSGLVPLDADNKDDNPTILVADPDCEVSDKIYYAQLIELLNGFLYGLSEVEKEVFTLFYFKALDHNDIANCSAGVNDSGHSRTILSRVKDKFFLYVIDTQFVCPEFTKVEAKVIDLKYRHNNTWKQISDHVWGKSTQENIDQAKMAMEAAFNKVMRCLFLDRL